MANGDVDHADIEAFLTLGEPFPADSDTTMTEADADAICDDINAEINLILKRLGFQMPITDTDSLTWLSLTKKFGAGALVLDGLMAQSTQEENTRAQRYWDRYETRRMQLAESGGEILDAAMETNPQPNRMPVLVGEHSDEGRKRYLRFPQRAAADHYDNDAEIAATGASWTNAIRGL
jgi:hypothetical protein